MPDQVEPQDNLKGSRFDVWLIALFSPVVMFAAYGGMTLAGLV